MHVLVQLGAHVQDGARRVHHSESDYSRHHQRVTGAVGALHGRQLRRAVVHADQVPLRGEASECSSAIPRVASTHFEAAWVDAVQTGARPRAHILAKYLPQESEPVEPLRDVVGLTVPTACVRGWMVRHAPHGMRQTFDGASEREEKEDNKEEATGGRRSTARTKTYPSGATEQEGGQRRGAAVALSLCVDRRDVGSARVHVAVGVARLGLSEDLEAGRLQQRIRHGARQSSIAHQERDWPNRTRESRVVPVERPFLSRGKSR